MTYPSLQFTRSVTANVSYWRQRTQSLADETLPILDRERQNLYRAARYGLHLPDTWRETAELVLQSFVLIERRGYWGEWIPMLEQLLGKCPVDELALRGRILDHLGIFYRNNNQLEKAFITHQAELQIGIVSEDQWRQAHACINLGAVCRQLHRFDEAEAYVCRAQKAFRAIHAPLVKHAFVTLELGLLAQAREQWPLAEEQFSYSLSLWREVGDPFYLANCLKLLGQVMASQNKAEEALKFYLEAMDQLNQTENHLDKSRTLNDLGILFFNQGNLAEAERRLLAADTSYLRQSGNLTDQAIIATNLGNVYLAQGETPAAEQAFRRSAALWQACGDVVRCANALGGLAETKAAQEHMEEAQHLYQQAIELLAGSPQCTWGLKLQERLKKEKEALKLSEQGAVREPPLCNTSVP